MRLLFPRLELDIELDHQKVSCLQIDDRTIFSRVTSALLSEQGLYAVEPYELINCSGRSVAPRNRLLIVNTLPRFPFGNRTLAKKFESALAQHLESDSKRFTTFQNDGVELEECLQELSASFLATYTSQNEWTLHALCKTLSFVPWYDEDDPLIDNCINFLSYCSDVGGDIPIVLINAKSFFTQNELSQIYDHAVFSGVSLMLVDSWPDNRYYDNERRTVLDLHLCSFDQLK